MPYIKASDREAFEAGLKGIVDADMCGPGELNYVISLICWGYLRKFGISYKTLNDIHGVLTAANLEFYRRVTSTYEDQKITENGDVYNGQNI